MDISPIPAKGKSVQDRIGNQEGNDCTLAILRNDLEKDIETLFGRLARNCGTLGSLIGNLEGPSGSHPRSFLDILAYAAIMLKNIRTNQGALQAVLEERELNIETVTLGHRILEDQIHRYEPGTPFPELPVGLVPDIRREQYRERYLRLEQTAEQLAGQLVGFAEILQEAHSAP